MSWCAMPSDLGPACWEGRHIDCDGFVRGTYLSRYCLCRCHTYDDGDESRPEDQSVHGEGMG